MTHLPSRREAAQARAAQVRTPADRPSARRGAAAPNALALVRAPLSRVKFRAAGDGGNSLTFDGYASVYERAYDMWDMFGPYSEVVSTGAAAETLAREPDVAFLLNHRGMTLARTKSGTLQLSEDETGLRSVADLDKRNTDVQNIQLGVERGDLDEMSFAFRITRGIWSPDYSEYRIEAFDIDRGDVSIVNFGANPETSGGFRSSQVLAGLTQLDDEELAQAEAALTMRRSQLATVSAPAGPAAVDLGLYERAAKPSPLAARFQG